MKLRIQIRRYRRGDTILASPVFGRRLNFYYLSLDHAGSMFVLASLVNFLCQTPSPKPLLQL